MGPWQHGEKKKSQATEEFMGEVEFELNQT